MTQTKKKLMILGAGPYQLPGIQKAVDLGFYVITVDYLPENIGHKFSHQSVNCSTVDKLAVLKIAKELDIDGVVTFSSDVAIPTVGFVAEKLGLPGVSYKSAQTMSGKHKFRSFQRKHGLNCPNFLIGQRLEDIEEKISTLSPPLMFKPVDTSGSRGITKVNDIDHEKCSKAFENAQSYSLSKTVCVEEYIEGVEVGGDAFLLNGQLAFVGMTHKHMRDYIVIGHSLPTNISSKDQRRVRAELITNCLEVGYTEGPLNFDVMVSPETVIILEMSPRLGGNGIPMIINRGTGADLITATIYYALGINVELKLKYDALRPCGSWIFGSSYSGLVKGIATGKEVQAAVPEVFEYFANYRIGEEVPEFIHNGNSLGYVLFDCPPHTSYNEIANRLQSELMLKVSPNHSNSLR